MILVVEDDPLFAEQMAERVAEMGYGVMGPALSLEAAEAMLAQAAPDAALLDGVLDGQSSAPLAARLAARGVPIAFVTGEDRIKGLAPELKRTPLLTKPVSNAQLEATLRGLLG
jgi:DNA-binding response OmpR family regulator